MPLRFDLIAPARRVPVAFSCVVLTAGLALPVVATSSGTLTAATSAPDAAAVSGFATGTKDVGVAGFVTQPGSLGIEGYSSATSGAIGTGVFGYSSDGFGVVGDGAAGVAGTAGVVGAGSSFGVYARSEDGDAVEGVSGDGVGVVAQSGTGMALVAMSSTKPAAYVSSVRAPGIYVTANFGDGIDATSVEGGDGIVGTSSGVNSDSQGVVGIDVSSPIPYGTSTISDGVLGTSLSGTGVRGIAEYFGLSGVEGDFGTTSSTAAGSLGVRSGVAGIDFTGGSAGVAGLSSNGYGVFAEASGSSGYPIVAEGPGGRPVMTLDAAGNLTVIGSLTVEGSPQFAVRGSDGAVRSAYAQRATEPALEDFGQVRLSGGAAYVPLDPAFAASLGSANYLVFITPHGPTSALYVDGESLRGFEIHAGSNAGALLVDYRIVGRPSSENERPRLAAFSTPHLTSPVNDPLVAQGRVRAALAGFRRRPPPKIAAPRLRTLVIPQPPRVP